MLTKLKSSNYFVKLNFEFEDQDKFYIGFEYCPGGELFNLIKK
jgi:serine/threonine protein kinase